MTILEKIQNAEIEMNTLKEKYLIQNGWVRTCKNPRCYWLWQKELNGVQIMVDKETAFGFQMEI